MALPGIIDARSLRVSSKTFYVAAKTVDVVTWVINHSADTPVLISTVSHVSAKIKIVNKLLSSFLLSLKGIGTYHARALVGILLILDRTLIMASSEDMMYLDALIANLPSDLTPDEVMRGVNDLIEACRDVKVWSATIGRVFNVLTLSLRQANLDCEFRMKLMMFLVYSLHHARDCVCADLPDCTKILMFELATMPFVATILRDPFVPALVTLQALIDSAMLVSQNDRHVSTLRILINVMAHDIVTEADVPDYLIGPEDVIIDHTIQTLWNRVKTAGAASSFGRFVLRRAMTDGRCLLVVSKLYNSLSMHDVIVDMNVEQTLMTLFESGDGVSISRAITFLCAIGRYYDVFATLQKMVTNLPWAPDESSGQGQVITYKLLECLNILVHIPVMTTGPQAHVWARQGVHTSPHIDVSEYGFNLICLGQDIVKKRRWTQQTVNDMMSNKKVCV